MNFPVPSLISSEKFPVDSELDECSLVLSDEWFEMGRSRTTLMCLMECYVIFFFGSGTRFESTYFFDAHLLPIFLCLKF